MDKLSEMPDAHGLPKPLNLAVSVFSGERRLGSAMCALWPDDKPREGALTMPHNRNWLLYAHLFLVMPDGTDLWILPKRVEHAPDAPPILIFDIGD